MDVGNCIFAGDSWDTDVVGALNVGMKFAWIVKENHMLPRYCQLMS